MAILCSENDLNFLNISCPCVLVSSLMADKTILALNYRLQVEQDYVEESGGDSLALNSFSASKAASLLMRQCIFDRFFVTCPQNHWYVKIIQTGF